MLGMGFIILIFANEKNWGLDSSVFVIPGFEYSFHTAGNLSYLI